jgi:hypothetical protein
MILSGEVSRFVIVNGQKEAENTNEGKNL